MIDATVDSRTRIREALAFRDTDILPVDLGSTRSTGINARLYHHLISALELPQRDVKVFDIRQYLAIVDEDVLGWAGSDTLPLYPLRPSAGLAIDSWRTGSMPGLDTCLVPSGYKPSLLPDGSSALFSEDGRLTHKRAADGIYFEDISPVFAEVDNPRFFASMPIPIPKADELDWLSVESARLKKSDKAVVATTPFSFFERGIKDFGYEEWLVKIMLEPETVRAYSAWLLESYLAVLDASAGYWKDCVDVVLVSDDLGTQSAPLIPPEAYKNLFYEMHAALNAAIKTKLPSAGIMLHSCGAVESFIPYFIDAGFTILNPVQFSAAGMDLRALKKSYGKDMVFWGGGINTQHTLAQGTPAEVQAEARRNIDILMPGGGFVFAPVHNIQSDVPVENVLALYSVVREHRKRNI